ncbi:hypothetical protein BaRGS_00032230 [Batillaria attramentaria]|uniref:Uncharacterized protein n=1 Tax=Batillaria attramentaria TaxID=370345 RepID=A0ABD0JPG1_9CAEN
MGTFTGGDGRGRHRAHNRTHDSAVEGVRGPPSDLFPCVESHYTRKDTKRQYLDASLNGHKNVPICTKKSVLPMVKVPVSCRKYRDVFNSEFNLSFHKPKKDQCMVCVNYAMKQKQGLVNEKEEQEFQRHTQLKMRAKAEKTQDKELAKKDPTKHVVTLDLQAVLPTPCGLVSQLYYKRKLFCLQFHGCIHWVDGKVNLLCVG